MPPYPLTLEGECPMIPLKKILRLAFGVWLYEVFGSRYDWQTGGRRANRFGMRIAKWVIK